jgi:hypothetical protein
MHKVLRAIGSGAIATTAMLFTLLLVDVETRSKLSLFEALARFFGMAGNVSLGILVFLFFGVIVWPVLFVYLSPYLPPKRDTAVKGAVFATLLWVAFVLIGSAQMDVILVLFYLIVTLLTHLVYGFILGLLYGWTGPKRTSRSANSNT